MNSQMILAVLTFLSAAVLALGATFPDSIPQPSQLVPSTNGSPIANGQMARSLDPPQIPGESADLSRPGKDTDEVPQDLQVRKKRGFFGWGGYWGGGWGGYGGYWGRRYGGYYGGWGYPYYGGGWGWGW